MKRIPPILVAAAFAVMAFFAAGTVPGPTWKGVGGRERRAARLSSREAEALAAEVFSKSMDALVLIRGSEGVGSGFVARADGKVWLYTNEHVARSGRPLVAKFIDGREITFAGTLEIAENRDVVRFEVDAATFALPVQEEAPLIDLPVFVFGNSDCGGVMTKLAGIVMGVGADKIEVNAQFVQGNSGSAILNDRGEVLGIATEARIDCEPKNWVKLDTRFNDIRRFGERLCDITWTHVEWGRYAQACRAYETFREFRDFIVPVCFKTKELVTDYKTADVPNVKDVPSLKKVLSGLVGQDRAYRAALSELESLLEKRKRIHAGSLQYPKDAAVTIRYRKLRRELLKSIAARKEALRTAMRALNACTWPCRRLKDDADRLHKGFRYCAETYDGFYDDSLSQIDWHEK